MDMVEVPSGKRLHNYGKIHHFFALQDHSLCQWPCLIANYETMKLPEGQYHERGENNPINHPQSSPF